MEILQDQVYEEQAHESVDPEVPAEEITVFEATEHPVTPRNGHYSEQTGHRERGLMNRAMRLIASRSVDVDESADVVSRGQLYLDRRLHVARYPRDGRR